jgi:hypothetical protein
MHGSSASFRPLRGTKVCAQDDNYWADDHFVRNLAPSLPHALLPNSFQNLAGNRSHQRAHDAHDNFWSMFRQPSRQANLARMT